MFMHLKLSHYMGQYYHAKAPMYNIKAYAKQFEEWMGISDAEMLAGLAFANSYAEGLIDESRITNAGFTAIANGLNGSIAGLEAANSDDGIIRTQIEFLQDAEARIRPHLMMRPELAATLMQREATGLRY